MAGLLQNPSGLGVRPIPSPPLPSLWSSLTLLFDSLVTYDAADLPVGSLRIRPNGKSGGQKGLESILNALNSKEIPRLKIGIGKPVACY